MQTNRTFQVEGRNGYYAVDEFIGTRCIRTVATRLTSSQASLMAGALANAYEAGRSDVMAERGHNGANV